VAAETEGARDLLRPLLDAVPGGVLWVASDGTILAANAEAVRLFGATESALVARAASELTTRLFDEEHNPLASCPISITLSKGEPHASTTVGMKQPDGTDLWTVLRVVPMRGSDERVTSAIATFLDITDRKRAEEELRQKAANWRVLAENLPDFVIVADRNATIEWINRVKSTYANVQIVGRPGFIFCHPDFQAEWRDRFNDALETGQPRRFEARIGSDTPPLWYELHFIPIGQESQPVERMLVIARNTTERRGMVARLAEKERLTSVGMLSASVAHEIMNPLTYVLGNLDFALSERCPPGARRTKAILDAREGAARMQRIVWDLRSLARAGTEDLFYVDVRSVIETALRLAGPELAKNVTVQVDLEEVPGVLASESRLCQVFINLVLNAVQAMSDLAPEERKITIRTKHDERRSMVGVDVSDTGSGILPEHLPRIFDPFFTTKETGTGLGLSISHESVARMGGKIDVTSERGRGTTFTVWLSTTRQAPKA
jgi:PAS domain S-box-containing protein